jgi:hypothetical protein
MKWFNYPLSTFSTPQHLANTFLTSYNNKHNMKWFNYPLSTFTTPNIS